MTHLASARRNWHNNCCLKASSTRVVAPACCGFSTSWWLVSSRSRLGGLAYGCRSGLHGHLRHPQRRHQGRGVADVAGACGERRQRIKRQARKHFTMSAQKCRPIRSGRRSGTRYRRRRDLRLVPDAKDLLNLLHRRGGAVRVHVRHESLRQVADPDRSPPIRERCRAIAHRLTGMALRQARLSASLSTRICARNLTASRTTRSLLRSDAFLAADLRASNRTAVSRAAPRAQGDAIADA